jgi:pimeloyl-ACP methyl ester carboxylesterase
MLFYTGSWVQKDAYKGFLDGLRAQNHSVRTEFHLAHESERQVLIGHSFGGYFALRDAMRHPDKTAAVILIHSHFNSRYAMPYPRIRQSEIQAPVLTILAGKDERLPFAKALDDLLERNREGLYYKFYHVFPNNTHFSGIVQEDGRESMFQEIDRFIRAIEKRNFSAFNDDAIYHRYRPRIERLTAHSIVASNPMGVIDAMLRMTMPRCLWDAAHWAWFLASGPEMFHFMYEDHAHVFWKGSPDDMSALEHALTEWTGDHNARLQVFHLPRLHPIILLWLSLHLFPYRSGDGTIILPVLYLNVRPSIAYYKIPHPDHVYRMLEPPYNLL